MILTNKLIGLMAEKQITKTTMAKKIGITPKTFGVKLKKGIFGSDEIEVMIDELNINDPMKIFFAKRVT